jgi:glycosidase
MSVQSDWFKQSSSHANSNFRNFFNWRHDDPRWGQFGAWFPNNGEFFFSSFSKNMADLNWRNPEIIEKMTHVFSFWAEKGVDGYRLDAARYYVEGPRGESDTPQTHDVLRSFVKDTKLKFPNTYFVGEIWADIRIIASYLNSGTQLDAAFDFPAASALLKALQTGKASDLIDVLRYSQTVVSNPWSLSPFITNHDMSRVATQLNQDVRKLKLAATVLLTMPGRPTIYYGEEIGLADSRSGSSPGDRAIRTPMQWDGTDQHGFTQGSQGPWQPFSTESLQANVADQSNRAPSLLNYYQKLIRLRKATPALNGGDIKILNSPDSRIGIYLRLAPADDGRKEFEVVVLNFSEDFVDRISLDFDGNGLPHREIQGRSIWGQAAGHFSNSDKAHATLHIENIPPINSSIVQF